MGGRVADKLEKRFHGSVGLFSGLPVVITLIMHLLRGYSKVNYAFFPLPALDKAKNGGYNNHKLNTPKNR